MKEPEDEVIVGGLLFWQFGWTTEGEIPVFRALRDKQERPVMISPVLSGEREGEYMLWWIERENADDVHALFFPSVYAAAKKAEELFWETAPEIEAT